MYSFRIFRAWQQGNDASNRLFPLSISVFSFPFGSVEDRRALSRIGLSVAIDTDNIVDNDDSLVSVVVALPSAHPPFPRRLIGFSRSYGRSLSVAV